MTVRELGQRLTSAEFSEWVALFKIEYEERLRNELERSAKQPVPRTVASRRRR